jgi:CubicO group peptidase (beta-lactamase class C family)
MAKIIAFILLFISVQATAQKINSDSIDYYLPNKFTGQIAIKKDSKFIFTKNVGLKNRNNGFSINDSTVFNIGHLSQTLVNYLILHLETTGKLKQSDNVSNYLTDFPYKNILIKHLLSHQSGLPGSYIKFYHKKCYNDWNIKLSERQKRFDNEDLLYLLSQKKPELQFNPGSSYMYSDFNFLILVSLIEKIIRTPFGDYVNLFFKNSDFEFNPIVSAKKDTIFNKAWGYRIFPDSSIGICDNLMSRGFYYNDGTNGNQHIYLSAKNMALWGECILKERNIFQLKTTTLKNSMGGFTYNEDLNVVIKKGVFGGVTSLLVFSPKNNFVISIHSSLLIPSNKGKEFNKLILYLAELS